MKRLRYLYYLAFAAGAVVFWLIVAVFVLGVFPVPYVPACQLEPGGCPEPTVWKELGGLVIAYGAIPATVLLFVFYRRWVRRKVGLADDW
jgi:hypothetical protein